MNPLQRLIARPVLLLVIVGILTLISAALGGLTARIMFPVHEPYAVTTTVTSTATATVTATPTVTTAPPAPSVTPSPSKTTAPVCKKTPELGVCVSWKGNVPSLKIPADAYVPTALTVETLKHGTGKTITGTDLIHARWIGANWDTRKTFDSFGFRADQKTASGLFLAAVIPGLSQGLTGVKVGSTVLVSIPAELAYGLLNDQEPSGRNGDLLFLVTIEHTERQS